jgi:hypothetical protein
MHKIWRRAVYKAEIIGAAALVMESIGDIAPV